MGHWVLNSLPWIMSSFAALIAAYFSARIGRDLKALELRIMVSIAEALKHKCDAVAVAKMEERVARLEGLHLGEQEA